jgi:hypothetical protein
MSSTQPIAVGNPTFLIDRMGLDCAPLQFVRELTQNAFEAIRKRRDLGWSGQGHVIWDVDWNLASNYGVFKLQVSDNGCGMTGPEIEAYINSLSSSSGVQSYDSNFGVGAKISAGKENPAGLIYQSWVDGDGVVATFWRDPLVGYGLKQWESSGHFAQYARLGLEYRCEPIDDRGTSVTLMGVSEDENTYWKGGALEQKWLIKYLNSRYYVLPENTRLQVRDFSRKDPSEWPTSPDRNMRFGGSQMRTIEGMKYFLTKYSEQYGTVSLTSATAHWFLLPEEHHVSGGVWDTTSHVAALFQSELYDVKHTREARAQLIHFGVIYGQGRVVLYIEPNVGELDVVANTARSHLLMRTGETSISLPWAQWAAEFRSKMPEPLRKMMDDILAKADSGNYAEEIKKRLREIRELLQLRKYRLTARGEKAVSGEAPGGTPREGAGPRSPRTNIGSKPKIGGADSDLYSAFITETGRPGEEVPNRDNTPDVRWISVSDGTREPDNLEDRAAQYLPDQNLILANSDFRGYQRVMEVLAAQYPHAEPSQVKQIVESWTSLQLTEAVLGVISLQGSPEWSSLQDRSAALSSEALTAVVMARYASISQMKRQLGSIVGRARNELASITDLT